ncbi:NDP-hexose 2,3-dehydratase family protein, partial [Marinitenerispora sediminis]
AAGHGMRTADFADWFAERTRAHRFRVERIPLAELDGWSFSPGTGNLTHRSGRFFTVEGLRAAGDEGLGTWEQPIIHQPEIGILGVLAKEFDGVLHFLMQAKMEPGNPGLVQLSPTVQATRSNYTRAHRGAGVRYVEHFTRPGRGRVLVDVLQSEHGAWFHRKSNRNVIVEAAGDVPAHEDFCWLTLGQIGELLRRDAVVNMDSRSVLACAPLPDHEPGALHSDTDVLSWLTTERSRREVRARLVPLAGLAGWERSASAVEHVSGRSFRVVAVRAAAGNREVPGWTQPLVEPAAAGVVAFVLRRFGGVPHLLARARAEGGLADAVELGPTVQHVPDGVVGVDADPPAFLDLVLGAGPERIRYSAVHSEEGGRFLNAVSRHLIVEAGPEEAPEEAPPGHLWVTPGQLTSLAGSGRYVNVQARTLLAAVSSRAAVL